MKKYIIFTLLACLSAAATHASDFSGKIKKVYVGPAYGSNVIVVLDRSLVAGHSCDSSASPSVAFYFDAASPGGNVWASAVLAAYAAQSNIVIQGGGAGSCSTNPNFPGAELLRLFRLE